MPIIYQPKGPAAEYADLAASLYRGCSHGCKYCYAPSVLRMDRPAFGKPSPRKDVLKQLEKDALKHAGTDSRVLMSFTTDPYQAIEAKQMLTREAIKILGSHGIPMNILTKNPLFAIDRDWYGFQKFDVHFGTSLCFTDDNDRLQWEPNAAPVADRFAAMELAHDKGIPTWLSIEPVINAAQALGVIMNTAEYIDHYRIGKLNHDKARESTINWRNFLFNALESLNYSGSSYRIKDGLWRFADQEIRERWQQSQGDGPIGEKVAL